MFLISVAKIDHIVIKSTAYSRILNEDNNEVVADHLNCNFGQWYTSEGKEQFGHTKSFKEVERPHVELHDKIKLNMKYLENDTAFDPTNTKDIIKNFKDMEDASVTLFTHLENMIKE
ncbi:CZB domain-containing protein [Sulfurimonas sp.]|nr:CZB domain-containing protein [Sulfurimonas sp.]